MVTVCSDVSNKDKCSSSDRGVTLCCVIGVVFYLCRKLDEGEKMERSEETTLGVVSLNGHKCVTVFSLETS